MNSLIFRSFADPVTSNNSPPNYFNTSSMPPPNGIESNFTDPAKPLWKLYLIVAIISLVLPTIFTILRLYTKIFLIKKFLLEDLAITLSWIGLSAWYAISLALPENGRHYWDVSLAQSKNFAQYLNIILIIFAPISFLAKYAIFAQLKKVFTKERNLIWWLVEYSIWANAVLYLALMFLSIFQCWPRSKLGDPYAEGHCLPFGILVVPPTIIILLTDIWMAALPILIVWKLQLALQRKYAIVGAFLVGVVSIAAVVLELYFSVKLAGSKDLTYGAYLIQLFAGVQMSSMIVAAAMPTIPHFWLRVRGVDMQESEPSPLGRLPPKQEYRPAHNMSHKDLYSHDEDIERAETPVSFDQPETPYEILTTTEVRVTSIRMGQKGLLE